MNMRLIKYKNLNNYKFYLEFENQISGEVNLEKLISKHLSSWTRFSQSQQKAGMFGV